MTWGLWGHTESAAAIKDHWEPGDTAHYEYHCDTGTDSSDYHLYQRTQQPVTVLGVDPDSDDFSDTLPTLADRAGEGLPRTYRVRFGDGHEDTAWEDELLTHPQHYSPNWAFRGHTAARLAAVVPGSTIFRGIDLTDLPDDLKTRAHHAIDGTADPHLHDDLLNHVGDNHGGFSGWWTDDPDNAKHYAAGGHQDDNPLRAVLATDWNGEGQDYDYTDDEVGDDDVPLRDEPPRPHTVLVNRPGSGWVNISHHPHTASRLAMPAPMPEGVTFHYHPTDDTVPTETVDWHPEPVPVFSAPAVEARHGGEHVGYLGWDTGLPSWLGGDDDPVVDMVKVHPDYRRHGVATALFDFARQHEPQLRHSDNRTGLGDQWVQHEQNRNNNQREGRTTMTAARLAMPGEFSDTPYIARGMTVRFPAHGHDLLRAVHEKRATPEQLLHLINWEDGHAGRWWMPYDSSLPGLEGEEGPREYAFGSDNDNYVALHADNPPNDLTQPVGSYGPQFNSPIAFPLVMIGQRPKRDGEWWSPHKHNPANPEYARGGNEQLDEGEEVPLHEVHYHTGLGGDDWVKVKMPPGTTVRAGLPTPPHTAARLASSEPPVVMWHPDDVENYSIPDNPIYGGNLPDLKDSITQNGIQRPLAIHTDGDHAVLADGHHRLMAAQELGLHEVPVQVHYGAFDFDEDDDPEADELIHEHLDQHHPGWRRGSGYTAARLAMPASSSNELHFKHVPHPDGGGRIEVHHPDIGGGYIPGFEGAGLLRWNPEGEIGHVYVDDRLQRQGIATEMLNRAREVNPEVHHSAHQTDAGKEWASHTAARDPFQHGACIEYAHALKQRFPHLQLGTLTIPDDEDDWQHVFMHDGENAYDSAGTHPMPYHGPAGQWEPHYDADFDWYDEPDPDLLDAAHKHIERHGIGPRTAARLAMPWYHNTDAELNPGDMLLPPTETGHKSQFADADPEMGTIYHPDKVYFYHHPTEPTHEQIADQNGPYANAIGFGKNTYQVEPVGHVERDPEWQTNREKWEGYYDDENEIPGYHDHMAPRARVVQRVEPKSDPSTIWGSPEYENQKRKARTMTAAVTVYTQPSCPQCDMTKKVLDKLGIEHETVDVTADPDAHAYVTGLGYQSAPVVVVGDGEEHWSGFRAERLRGLVE